MTESADRSAEPKPRRSPFKRIATAGLPVLVIAGAMVLAGLLLMSRPTAQQTAKTQAIDKARLVTVTPAEAAPARLMISANGTVEAAQSTQLRARVSGQIVALTQQLAPGTRFHKGEVLARIDDADYQLALTQARSQLDNARASLQTENGQQAVAKRELALVGSSVSRKERNLALRGPQLATAKANVESARSQVGQAELNLKRTAVRAPFSGIVTDRSASVGDVVSTADTLAKLAATDAYWVDVSLPVDQLRWLHEPGGGQSGSAARIYYPAAWGDDAYKPASVLRIQGALETDGRLARVLLKVPHPLGQNRPDGHRLLLGAYVEAHLAARMPSHSVMIDSSLIRENDEVWVMTDTDKLDIRSVRVAYRDATRAVISSGLAPGDEVISSDLNAPIQGMPVRVDKSTPAKDAHKTGTATAASRKATRPVAPGNDQRDHHSDNARRAAGRHERQARNLRMAPAFDRLVPPARNRT